MSHTKIGRDAKKSKSNLLINFKSDNDDDSYFNSFISKFFHLTLIPPPS